MQNAKHKQQAAGSKNKQKAQQQKIKQLAQRIAKLPDKQAKQQIMQLKQQNPRLAQMVLSLVKRIKQQTKQQQSTQPNKKQQGKKKKKQQAKKKKVKKRAMKFAKKLSQLPLPDMRKKLQQIKQQKPKFGKLVERVLHKGMKKSDENQHAKKQQKALKQSKEYSGSPKSQLYEMMTGIENKSNQVLGRHADEIIKTKDDKGQINQPNTESDNYFLEMAQDFLMNSEPEADNSKNKDEEEKGEDETAYKKS